VIAAKVASNSCRKNVLMTLSTMTFSIVTLAIMTLCIMKFSMMELSIVTLSITILITMTISIIDLTVALSIRIKSRYAGGSHFHTVVLSVIMTSNYSTKVAPLMYHVRLGCFLLRNCSGTVTTTLYFLHNLRRSPIS
jgi:hypothetical protein